MGKVRILLTLLALIFVTSAQAQDAADVVYTNGKIYTVNEAQPWAEAMAVKDGRLLDVTNSQNIDKYIGANTKVVNLQGRFVMPGINDLHHHGIDVSGDVANDDIHSVTEEESDNIDALLAAIKRFAVSRPDLDLIFVDGYSVGLFPGDNAPKELLDEIDSSRPIIVFSTGGHAMWGNSKTLEMTGISADTPDPEYGVIARKSGSREPIGTVHESAMQLFWALTTYPSKELINVGAKDHTARINQLGITGVRIAGITQKELEVVTALDKAGELNAYHSLAFHWRTSYIARKDKDLERIRKQIIDSKNFETENVASAALKYYADGAPSSKTAYLLEDYVDDPGNRSELQMDEKLFMEEFAFWHEHGITTMTHVVGDGASRAVLDAVEAAQKQHGKNNVRHHMTHSVLIDPADMKRFKPLDMVVDLSPAIAAPMAFHSAYKHNFGDERHERFFPARALLDAGATLMVASDYPVGPDNPWTNLEVWHTRMNPWGMEEGTLGGHSAITLEEAIEAATLAGAYGLYKENEFGSLEPGKRATFVVLDRNLFEIPPADLSETQVLQTYFNGRLVYDAQKGE